MSVAYKIYTLYLGLKNFRPLSYSNYARNLFTILITNIDMRNQHDLTYPRYLPDALTAGSEVGRNMNFNKNKFIIVARQARY